MADGVDNVAGYTRVSNFALLAVVDDVREAGLVRTFGDDVLEADVEGRVGVRGEGVAILANYVLGPTVVVADGVLDLEDISVMFDTSG